MPVSSVFLAGGHQALDLTGGPRASMGAPGVKHGQHSLFEISHSGQMFIYACSFQKLRFTVHIYLRSGYGIQLL